LILIRLGTALVAVAMLLSLWASPDRVAGLPWFIIAMVGVALVGVVSSPLLTPVARRVRPAHMATFFISATIVTIGVTLLTSRWSMYKFAWLDTIYGILPSIRSLPYSWAKQGLSPNQTGGMLALCTAATAAMAIFPWRTTDLSDGVSPGEPANRLWRRTAIVVTVVGIIVVFMTGSRAALAGITVAVLLLLIYRTYRIWWGWVAAIAVAVIGLGASGRLTRIFDFFIQDESLNTKLIARLDIWSSALRGIQDHLITGIGLGVFNDIMPVRYPYQTVGLSYSVSGAHNLFLDVALTIGIPGVLGFSMLLLGCIMLGIRMLSFGNASKIVSLAILGSMVSFLVFGITDQISFSIPTSFIVWIWAACLITLSKRSLMGPTGNLSSGKFRPLSRSSLLRHALMRVKRNADNRKGPTA
jgi:O-antigen ligase